MLSRRDLIRSALFCLAAPAASRVTVALETQFVGDSVFAKLMRHARELRPLPIGRAVGEIGMLLAGTPYVGNTLEIDDRREICSVNLEGLDCVTFYEISLCFARMLTHGGRTPSDLLREVELTRYRGGKLDGYLSRLHYTSDWIEDNERKGVVENLSRTLPGAVRLTKSFDYMSRHPEAYRQLRSNPGLVPRLAAIEREISSREPWYVPNAGVPAIEHLLQTGDIVGIVTSAEGLDCSHTGLVYVDRDGTRRFLNASSVKKEVVLGERLSDYAVKYRKNLGVMIARPLPLHRR